jgi:hypothetical protein
VKHHQPAIYGGGSCSAKGIDRLRALGWGQCYSEGPGLKAPPLRWFFDNGAWEAFVKGVPFPEAKWMGRIDRCLARGYAPEFAVLPDVVGDPVRTLDLAARLYAFYPEGWPKYLPLQNGAIPWQVSAFLKKHRCAGLFLGGNDDFKNRHAKEWCDRAHDWGLKFHYARAGTPRKFEHAMIVGADSLDSSRLSRDGREWSDFARCRHIWLKGGHPRLFSEKRGAA